MKIALLTPTFCGFSGIDRVVETQSATLTAGGHSVTIFALQADMEPPPGVTLRLLGMPGKLLWQRFYRLLFPLAFCKNGRYARMLRGFDTVYSHQYPMNWLAWLAKRDYKVQYIYYDYGVAPPESFSGIIERTYMWLFTLISGWTARKADSAVSISNYLKKELKKDTGLDSEVAYPSINMKRFHPGIDGSAIRQKYNLAGRPVILYLGRISPHKGIHLLIEAFKQARQKSPEAALLIVGKHTFPRYTLQLKQLADDNVIFSGYVGDEDIPLYYAACDIYASATLWEGFNLPLAEAQACARPVVAFNLGPHPEVVEHDRTGLLVPEADTGALAAALVKLLGSEELRRQMGNAAAGLVKARFA
jgi:glycosyltransferase involved in cell wall biosynthesis